MPPSFFDRAKKRHSIYEFSKKPVDERKIQKILEFARWAPSSHNDQNWHFILVRNKDLIGKLMADCLYGAFHSHPIVLIAIVALPIYNTKPGLLRPGVTNLAEAHRFMNIGFVADHMVQAATQLGIGSAILSPTGTSVDAELGVPEHAHVPVMIALGHEQKGAYKKNRERKPIRELVSREKYAHQ